MIKRLQKTVHETVISAPLILELVFFTLLV